MIRTLTTGLLLVVLGCAKAENEPAKPSKTVVVAVNHPLAMFARQIGKNHVEVVMPVPAGKNPAYWRPGPDTIAEIQQADLILLNGADYARWTGTASLPSDRTLVTSDKARDRWIEYETAGHSHGPGDVHTHTHTATHTWLDPDIALSQGQAIRDALTNDMPEYQDEFRSNFALLRRYILEESARLETAVNADRERPVFFSSPNYFYLQRRYGINGHAFEWAPNTMPDEEQWTAMETVLETHPARWMIWESAPTPEIAERLRTFGVESVVFEPADTKPEKGDYIDAIRRGADTLSRVYDYEE
ncbi:MAG: metal ABC transporter substrate-binding protein [Phycisphaerales bacterium]|nr:metal ABC transporter substrate-binding protein [Phycisphaerales bacterium]